MIGSNTGKGIAVLCDAEGIVQSIV
ncbi:MAG: hypothetical protein JWL90_1552, partial [Chthoniobacteraceae bacterium]|nr:hypothetical protein [Chthoniobacteraceae bacterium]